MGKLSTGIANPVVINESDYTRLNIVRQNSDSEKTNDIKQI
jgi:hypothetical protein